MNINAWTWKERLVSGVICGFLGIVAFMAIGKPWGYIFMAAAFVIAILFENKLKKNVEGSSITDLLSLENKNVIFRFTHSSTIKIDLTNVKSARLGEEKDEYISVVLDKGSDGEYHQIINTRHPERHKIPELINSYVQNTNYAA